jgi:hypothetical protein
MFVKRIKDSIRYRAGLTAAAMLPEFVVIAATSMWRHKLRLGTLPNFVRPQTFNEKVLHRIVFDRRPVLTRIQDKYAVRDYVAGKLGASILPRLYWATTNPFDIPFDDLPDRFVVKPTHGSGWYRIVSDKADVDRRELIETCQSWLSQNYYHAEREWVYKHIDPRILVEEYVDDGAGVHPIRYKFYVFHGSARVVEVCVGVPEQASIGFYGRSWDRLPVRFSDWKEIDAALPRPTRLDEMIECAETLAGGLDFVRVDLYGTDTSVVFGEMTTCPGGGVYSFDPPAFNRSLGAFWDLSAKD